MKENVMFEGMQRQPALIRAGALFHVAQSKAHFGNDGYLFWMWSLTDQLGQLNKQRLPNLTQAIALHAHQLRNLFYVAGKGTVRTLLKNEREC